MGSRTIRVTVRGAFDGLTAEQRAALLADAAAHDVAFAAFTAEGSLTYDIAARPFFTFRFADSVDEEREIPAATARAEAAAVQWLTSHGYAFKNLSAQAVDMSQTPLGKRGRREAAR
ncbi:DUF6204 family protein [Couchioplanes caeruleus]|uniref:Uncharacterized protein n=2 Tax=Couchioplanes caeruleus TaxID=56438 RepID=A0A1K0H1B6_9ACTN|nr:DUF6204 family protein [Couchioplanes caeruleus]OJF15491.1 hypothetical protein BG844_04465 [Couchioplanes caeruleus subsp. caeruleus]ROP27536.1 hypothetical protein EDD30_0209 [Couchioplanes caeruleus]